MIGLVNPMKNMIDFSIFYFDVFSDHFTEQKKNRSNVEMRRKKKQTTTYNRISMSIDNSFSDTNRGIERSIQGENKIVHEK